MRVETQQLRAFLLDAGLITKKKFDQVFKKAERTDQKVGDVLVSENIISEDELIKLEAYILGIPFVDLEKREISSEVLRIIPEPVARSHNIVAFRKKGNNLEVAMLDPADLRTIEFIKKKAGLKILPRLATPTGIKNVLRQYQKTLEAEFGDIIKKDAGIISPLKEEKAPESQKELKKVAEELPVIRIVDTLIHHAILQRSSDIHIEPLEKELIVRYRIDGILRDAMVLPKKADSGIVARIKVLSDLKLDEHRLPQDGRFKVETEDYKYSIRVSVLPVINGEKIVMRLLSESAKAQTLEEIGLRNDSLERVQTSLRKPVGMILVTGPTGSGKTTTLYTIMDLLNDPQVNISTIEDPVEYRMPRINQTQVNKKIGLTFASGLRSLVRQDPDVIMVGEIRDEETASLAVNAALTGHLVLSTLHTTNAAGAIPRLIDMGVEPFLISSTLNVILAQRLVRKLCDEKKKYTLKKSEVEALKKQVDTDKILGILKGEKLANPNDSFEEIAFCRPEIYEKESEGYLGRIGIFEVLVVSETIKELINKEANTSTIQKQAQQEGMRTMVEDGFIKATQGITSIEEILRVIKE
jgi:type IV pilus assembly protein PilB